MNHRSEATAAAAEAIDRILSQSGFKDDDGGGCLLTTDDRRHRRCSCCSASISDAAVVPAAAGAGAPPHPPPPVGLARCCLETKSGWCLRAGLIHCYAADGGKLAPLIERHGVPGFYGCVASSSSNNTGKNGNKKRRCRHDGDDNGGGGDPIQDLKDPATCFQSLCRIVAGQFVSGSSARAAWLRLLALEDDDGGSSSPPLTEETVLRRVERHGVEAGLQRPAGLTKAKAASIVDLSRRFRRGELSESFFLGNNDESDGCIRDALLQVKGIGPWSVDMFLMFYLEHQDVLPLGDLGIRKGIARYFYTDRSAQLCPKKDADRVHRLLEPYEPYRSLVTYYMWKAADSPLPSPDENGDPCCFKSAAEPAETEDSKAMVEGAATPPPNKKTKGRRTLVRREVTP